MPIDSITFELDHADLHICGEHIAIFPDHDTTKPPIELCTVNEMLRMIEAAVVAQGKEVENGENHNIQTT